LYTQLLQKLRSFIHRAEARKLGFKLEIQY